MIDKINNYYNSNVKSNISNINNSNKRNNNQDKELICFNSNNTNTLNTKALNIENISSNQLHLTDKNKKDEYYKQNNIISKYRLEKINNNKDDNKLYTTTINTFNNQNKFKLKINNSNNNYLNAKYFNKSSNFNTNTFKNNRWDYLHSTHKYKIEKNKLKLSEKKQLLEKEEMERCTFRPTLNNNYCVKNNELKYTKGNFSLISNEKYNNFINIKSFNPEMYKEHFSFDNSNSNNKNNYISDNKRKDFIKNIEYLDNKNFILNQFTKNSYFDYKTSRVRLY